MKVSEVVSLPSCLYVISPVAESKDVMDPFVGEVWANVIVCPSGSVDVLEKLKVLEFSSSIVKATADTVGAEFTALRVKLTFTAALWTVPS